MLDLSTITNESQEDINETLKKASSASNDSIALSLLLKGLSDVREAVSSAAISHVSVDNLDEVKAGLHNELNRISKPIIQAIRKLSLDNARIEDIVKNVQKENSTALESSHDIQIVKKPKQRLEVSNLSDIAFPSSINVSNLEELKSYFDMLINSIKNDIKVDVPAPQVNVSPPEITIPEIAIPESSLNIDLDSVIKALDPLKYISPKANKPISVRLSDGNKFVKALKTMIENQERQATAFSQGLNEASATKAFKKAQQSFTYDSANTGSVALTDNTAGVAIGSGACKAVDVTAYGGLVSIGTSTSVRVDSSANGVVLTPGSAYYRIYTSNLGNVFASGATGSRACYVYYT